MTQRRAGGSARCVYLTPLPHVVTDDIKQVKSEPGSTQTMLLSVNREEEMTTFQRLHTQMIQGCGRVCPKSRRSPAVRNSSQPAAGEGL